MRTTRYGLASLRKQFPDDDACLQFIFNARHKVACHCGGRFKRVTGRKQFQCSSCRLQIAPAASSIFNKSRTPLLLWFHAILAFINARGEISAKQLERDLEITYKCAWRMLRIIRIVLEPFTHLKSHNLSYPEVLRMAIKAKGGTHIQKRRRKLVAKKSRMAEVRFNGIKP